jgi:hypothetical protein
MEFPCQGPSSIPVKHSSEESCAVCWFRRSHSSRSRNIRRSALRAAASRVFPPMAASAASLRGRSNVVTWSYATGGGASSREFLNSSLNNSTGDESTSRRKPSRRDEADLLRLPSCKTTDFITLPEPPAVCSAPFQPPDAHRAPGAGATPQATVTHGASKGGGRSRPISFLPRTESASHFG